MKVLFQLILALLLTTPAFSQTKERPYLKAALQTESWIDSKRVDTKTGCRWVIEKPDSVEMDTLFIYHGNSGVVLFYLELYNTTKDKRFLDKASKGMDYVLNAIPDTVHDEWSVGYYIGWSGVAYTMIKMYKATNNEKYLAGAKQCIDIVEKKSKRKGDGIVWDGLADMLYGSAGIGLVLLDMEKELSYPKAKELAIATGNGVIQQAIHDKKGYKWVMQPKDTADNLYMPNFSHGTAGDCYFLLRLYEETKDKKYLDAAMKGVEHLESVTNDKGLIYHDTKKGLELYYLGFCHGPVGTSRVYYQLYKQTKEQKWLDKIRLSSTTAMTCGLPDTLQPGFWNNISQCCGSAGLAQYYLDLYKIFNDKKYLAFSKKVTENLLSRATTDNTGMKWTQAEQRKIPKQLIAQTGYAQGAAGVGMWLLHLDAYENGISPAIKLPDIPY